MIEQLIQISEDKKGSPITLYDVTGQCSYTEHILCVGVKNTIQLKAIENAYQTFLKQCRDTAVESDDFLVNPKVSGSSKSGWIILDLDGIVIHVITQDLREFYELDKLFESQSTSVEHF